MEQACSAIMLLGCSVVLVLPSVLVVVLCGRRHQTAMLLQHSTSCGCLQLKMFAFHHVVAIDGGVKVLVPATGRGLHQPINTTSFHLEVLHLGPCHIHLVLFYGSGARALKHHSAAMNSKNFLTCSEILNIKVIIQNIGLMKTIKYMNGNNHRNK
jgi:hypothetical protein